MRLLDLDRLAIGLGRVFADKKIAKPRAGLLALEAGIEIGRPKVLGISDALFEAVVLVVADALVLGFEFDGR